MAKGIKTGGRTKGTQNIITLEIRERFTLLLENNIDKLQNDINSLDPKDRIKNILELAKFVVPTLKATDLIINNENEDTFDYTLLTDKELKTILAIYEKYNND